LTILIKIEVFLLSTSALRFALKEPEAGSGNFVNAGPRLHTRLVKKTYARDGRFHGGQSPQGRQLRWQDFAADQITWQGIFRGHAVCVVSTVRLVLGNLAHFNVNSAARIGARSWKLPGGHYVDLTVESRRLSNEDLLAIGKLAAAMDSRPVRVRRRGERLAEGRQVEAARKEDSLGQAGDAVATMLCHSNSHRRRLKQ
jgi:hypothetical protein